MIPNSIWGSLLKSSLFLILLLGLNLIFSSWFTRWDFTTEKRFTLTKNSIYILEAIDKPIRVQVFLEGNFPAPFKRLRLECLEILNELASYSKGKLTIELIDPLESSSSKTFRWGDTLHHYGIEPLNVQLKTKDGAVQKEIFPGALLKYGGRKLGIALLQNQNQFAGSGGTENMINQSVENLEFVFINGIKKISDPKPPVLALVEGNGETFGPQTSDLIQSLTLSYPVGRIDLQTFPLSSLVKISLLILIKPQRRFTEPEKYKLDQYIMRGGKILGFMENVHAELDSLGKNGTSMGLAENLGLDDFLFRFGIRIQYNLLKDLNCSPIPVLTGGDGSAQNLEPWVYYPLALPVGNHPIIRNLDPVRLQFASTLDTTSVKGIQKTFLLTSSPYSQVASTPVLIQLAEVSDPADKADLYKGGRQNLAVLVEGSFYSSFKNRNIAGLDSSLPFQAKSPKTALIMVSDGDLPLNQVNSLEKTIYPLGYDKYSGQVFGNKIFVQNAVEYLTDPDGLVSLRSKEVKLRLLNKPLMEERKNFEQLSNFLIPILWVLLTSLGFAGFRAWKYSRSSS